MIRKAWNKDKWLLTPQNEHSRIAGLMAAAWNYPGQKPHEEVVIATARLDEGWKAAEFYANVNEAGAPMQFDEVDRLKTVDFWRKSAANLAEEGKYYAARLVAGHFVSVANSCFRSARLSAKAAVAFGAFIGEQQVAMRRWQQACMQNSVSSAAISELDTIMDGDMIPRVQRENWEDDLRLLNVCDALSLILCSDFIGDTEIPDVPYMASGNTIKVIRHSEKLALTLDPLPFRKNLRDHVTAVVIPRKIYQSVEELRGVIRATKPMNIEFHIGAPQA